MAICALSADLAARGLLVEAVFVVETARGQGISRQLPRAAAQVPTYPVHHLSGGACSANPAARAFDAPRGHVMQRHGTSLDTMPRRNHQNRVRPEWH